VGAECYIPSIVGDSYWARRFAENAEPLDFDYYLLDNAIGAEPLDQYPSEQGTWQTVMHWGLSYNYIVRRHKDRTPVKETPADPGFKYVLLKDYLTILDGDQLYKDGSWINAVHRHVSPGSVVRRPEKKAAYDDFDYYLIDSTQGFEHDDEYWINGKWRLAEQLAFPLCVPFRRHKSKTISIPPAEDVVDLEKVEYVLDKMLGHMWSAKFKRICRITSRFTGQDRVLAKIYCAWLFEMAPFYDCKHCFNWAIPKDHWHVLLSLTSFEDDASPQYISDRLKKRPLAVAIRVAYLEDELNLSWRTSLDAIPVAELTPLHEEYKLLTT